MIAVWIALYLLSVVITYRIGKWTALKDFDEWTKGDRAICGFISLLGPCGLCAIFIVLLIRFCGDWDEPASW